MLFLFINKYRRQGSCNLFPRGKYKETLYCLVIREELRVVSTDHPRNGEVQQRRSAADVVCVCGDYRTGTGDT